LTQNSDIKELKQIS